MGRRLDPTYFEDEDGGWDQYRFGGQSFDRQTTGPKRRRSNTKNAYHGRAKRSRRNRDGWDRHGG